MSEPQHDFAELDALLASLAAGTLDETGDARLEELVSTDLASRRRYLEKTFLIGALQARLGAMPSLPFAPTPHRLVSPSPRHRLSRRQVAWSVLAASVLFAAYFVGISWNMLGKKLASSPDSPTRPLAHSPTRSEPVATIVGSEEVQWSSSEISDRKSQIEKGERLRIESGLVEVELEQGARLVIEGPAEWSIDGANSATLKRGKLVASVPTRAIGFAIETPTARIVDLGTEFGVAAENSSETRVEVFRGEVTVDHRSGAARQPRTEPVAIRAGESMVVSAKRLSQTTALPEGFAILGGERRSASGLATRKPASSRPDFRLDPEIWQTNNDIPQGQAQVSVDGGLLKLVNRGYLVSRQDYRPTAERPLRIHGKCYWVGPDDFMQVLTRSNGLPDPDDKYGEASQGIEFFLNVAEGIGTASILARGAELEIANVASAGQLSVRPGIVFSFEVIDSGSTVSFSVWQSSRPEHRSTATAQVTRDTTTRQQVVLHNRERSGVDASASTDRILYVDGFTIEQAEPSAVPAEASSSKADVKPPQSIITFPTSSTSQLTEVSAHEDHH